jgi:hypothetical protein
MLANKSNFLPIFFANKPENIKAKTKDERFYIFNEMLKFMYYAESWRLISDNEAD